MIRLQLRCRPKATAADLATLTEVAGWLTEVHGFLLRAEQADQADAGRARRAFERILTVATLEVGGERRRHEGGDPTLVAAVRRVPPLT